MRTSNVEEWIKKAGTRKSLLLAMRQPLTATQISEKIGVGRDTCSYILSRLVRRGAAMCLNPKARSSRLYTTTPLGRKVQERLQPGFSDSAGDEPDIDWTLFGWLCFRHRGTVLRILMEPMQPAEMKRRIRRTHSRTTISANNVRDIIRLFLARGLVRKVHVRRKAHARYELTEQGEQYRRLLNLAHAR